MIKRNYIEKKKDVNGHFIRHFYWLKIYNKKRIKLTSNRAFIEIKEGTFTDCKNGYLSTKIQWKANLNKIKKENYRNLLGHF